MTRQKFRRWQPPSAFALQFQNPQRILAAANHDAGFVRRQNSPLLRRIFRRLPPSRFSAAAACLQLRHRRLLPSDVSPPTAVCSGQKRERAGPGREGAQPVPDGLRRLVPVDAAVLLFDFGRVTRAFGRLRHRLDFSGNVIRNGLHEQFRPSCASRSWRVAESSSGRMGVRRCETMGPVSRPASIFMMVTPVSVSPLAIAH